MWRNYNNNITKRFELKRTPVIHRLQWSIFTYRYCQRCEYEMSHLNFLIFNVRDLNNFTNIEIFQNNIYQIFVYWFCTSDNEYILRP